VVNIVVYPKPSVLIYEGFKETSEVHIDESTIQPLLIPGVTIMAKKTH